MPSFIQRLTRRKHVSFETTELPRVLTTFDLTLLGIGSTVGVGFYVLAGQVARSVAGPAVIISFLIAAIASIFAGLCYAEFGARVPKAGSAYVYSYVCVGEFVAFIIGWNLVLEYIIGTASVARGYSGYVDGLANNSISGALEEAMPINVSFLSKYPDFLSFGLIFVLSVLLSLGVKESSILNSLCTVVTLIIVTYTIIALATQANGENWALTPEALNETCSEDNNRGRGWGKGGFAPYGFAGIMQGAATCFFGFVGFDCIATTGEEAIRPERSIPLSIGLSLFFVFLAYFGMSSTITLALPYCKQDANAPLVAIFNDLGWETSKWIISIGALFGFSASLFGILLPLPRVIYAMADDGILFRSLAKISKRFKTPAVATIASGVFAALMAMFFNLDTLVDMMSIGTLLAYTIVALSVMLLRYSNVEMRDWKSQYTLLESSYADDDDSEPRGLLDSGEAFIVCNHSSVYTAKDYCHQLFNIKCVSEPTDLSASLVSYATLVFCVLSGILSMLLVILQKSLSDGESGAIASVTVMGVLTFVNVVVIARQPQSKKQLAFKVPLVPWIPAVSSIINLYLMFNLSSGTWIRFAIWMAVGILQYFGYSIHNSSEEYQMQGERPPSLNFHREDLKNIGTIFDSDSEDELFVQHTPDKNYTASPFNL
ncbi:high affinity cationic amino acid transporter 1 [Macrobrachium rosenbergii]|uniref:high affinity cationic amino acid transporter 1 n=1 Tax=Macrobrachium rosenbergii TaxID=79674 RepID=UPI0034D5014F